MSAGLASGALERLLESVHDFVYVYDLGRREAVYVNRRWIVEFGYSLADAEGNRYQFFQSILHPDDVAAVQAHHAALARALGDAPVVLTFRIRRKSGDYAWMECRDLPFERDAHGAIVTVVGIARDVTHEKELEQKRAESEARFRAMIEHLPEALFIAGMDGRLLEVNAVASEQLGRSRDELLGMSIREVVAPEFHARVRDSLPGGPRPFVDSVHVRKDGSRVPVEVALVPMQLEGKPVMLGVARDLTERRAAEARSRQEAELRAAIIEHAIEGICVSEPTDDPRHLRFSLWNPRMTEITGYTLDEMNELGWFQTLYANPAEQTRAIARLQKLRGGQGFVGEEWTLRRRDGSQRQVLVSARVLTSLSGAPKMLGVLEDVTDRQRLERQLRDAQRMESMGRLSGAVAHDFNNLLQAILGGASLLEVDPSLSTKQSATVRDILAAAQRGADLTRQLLTFSRRQRAEVRLFELGVQVGETLRVARRLITETIHIEQQLAPDCWIQGDPGMLDQVVMNLAVNARDAMPEGGTLHVKVAPIASTDRPEGVLLEVADSGVGMAPETLAHIFEPFFTTKPEGEGTGLGLATVYGIVTQHGGQISVDSTPGAGTTFRVWLRRAARPRLSAPAPPAARPAPCLHVLLIDEHEGVRRTTARLLGQLGHRVREAATRAEALAALDARDERFDLVLTDIALGGARGGLELASELRRRAPDLTIMYMSNYDELLARLPLIHGKDFIQKPFTLEQLSALLSSHPA